MNGWGGVEAMCIPHFPRNRGRASLPRLRLSPETSTMSRERLGGPQEADKLPVSLSIISLRNYQTLQKEVKSRDIIQSVSITCGNI